MPLMHCKKCHHEFEHYGSEKATCDWCGGDAYVLGSTDLEKWSEKLKAHVNNPQFNEEDFIDWCVECGAEHDYMCGPCEKCGCTTFTKEKPMKIDIHDIYNKNNR